MTGTDLVTIPLSGEAIDLAACSTGELGAVLSDLREAEGRVREIKQRISAVIHERLDANAAWTVREGAWKITGRSPAPVVEWDTQGLMEELDAMVSEGLVTAEAAGRAVTTKVEYKVAAAGVKALLKLPGVASRLEPFRREVEPVNRTVTVTRVA